VRWAHSLDGVLIATKAGYCIASDYFAARWCVYKLHNVCLVCVVSVVHPKAHPLRDGLEVELKACGDLNARVGIEPPFVLPGELLYVEALALCALVAPCDVSTLSEASEYAAN
jgi:hypothetical protein